MNRKVIREINFELIQYECGKAIEWKLGSILSYSRVLRGIQRLQQQQKQQVAAFSISFHCVCVLCVCVCRLAYFNTHTRTYIHSFHSTCAGRQRRFGWRRSSWSASLDLPPAPSLSLKSKRTKAKKQERSGGRGRRSSGNQIIWRGQWRRQRSR